MKPKLTAPLALTGLLTMVLLYCSCDHTGRMAMDPRNIELYQALAACETHSAAEDVRVGYTLAGDISFDLRALKPGARRIDPVHLLLQFAHKIRDRSYGNLILATQGEERYHLPKAKADELGYQYAMDARNWAFNHLPEFVLDRDGRHPFGAWEGGLLGVLTKQLEDLGTLLNTWLKGVE